MLLRRTNKQCEQNLRFTNNANKSREISPKKFWLLSWTPKDFEKSTRLVKITPKLPKTESIILERNENYKRNLFTEILRVYLNSLPNQWRKSVKIIRGDETEPSKVAHIKKHRWAQVR